MDLTSDHHKCLNQLCRVCGSRVQTKQEKQQKRKPSTCASQSSVLKSFYGIDITSDKADLHPSFVCRRCTIRARNATRGDVVTQYPAIREKCLSLNKTFWVSHGENCGVCAFFAQSCRPTGGRKQVKLGRPVKNIPFDLRDKDIFSKLFETECTLRPQNCELIFFKDMYTCTICKNVFGTNTVVTPCHHYFCSTCLTALFMKKEQNRIACEICERSFSMEEVEKPPPLFLKQLLQLRVKCTICQCERNYETFKDHACEDSEILEEVSIDEPPDDASFQEPLLQHSTPKKAEIGIQTTPSKLLNYATTEMTKAPVSQALTKNEDMVFTHMVKRKFETSGDSTFIECKTKGQPVVLCKSFKPRVTSAVASAETLRRRALAMTRVRHSMVGSTRASTRNQIAKELKRVSKAERAKIGEQVGFRQRLKLSGHQSLCMKSQMRLSWTQFTTQKRILRKVGVQFESDNKIREEQKIELGDHLKGNIIPFLAKDTSSKEKKAGMLEIQAPMVSVTDLQSFVIDRLNSLDSVNGMTWHGELPKEEIWLKTGGDHGGRGITSTFKQALQVVNTTKPNSKNNTVVIRIFSAKDYRENLERGLKDLNEQIQNLRVMKWRGKRIRLFLFGDYDYLCNLYGLSGAAGVHPCLWCKVSKTEMQISRKDRGSKIKRNLQNLKMDHQRFVTEGEGKKKLASKYSNVIASPILDIDISHICPPDLHILLGVMKKQHELLEDECHQIDLMIARQIFQDADPDDTSEYGCYLIKLKDLYSISIELADVKEELDNPNLTQHQISMKKKKEKALELDLKRKKSNAILVKRTGPVAANLDVVLNKHTIRPQAYHGRSFIGNHCHRYLKEEVYSDLLQSIVDKIQGLVDDAVIQTRGKQLQAKFMQLLKLFAAVHKEISHSHFIEDDHIANIEAMIDGYLEFFRMHFPEESITPKLHILEDHVIPFLKRWHFGLAIHKEFNRLSCRAWGAQNELDKLMILTKERFLETSVNLQH